jgi:hypothetical protein
MNWYAGTERKALMEEEWKSTKETSGKPCNVWETG